MSQITEQHSEYKHQTLIRFEAEKLEKANQKQNYWASHWYPSEDDSVMAEAIKGEYLYDCGSVAVSCGGCKEISKASFIELEGIVSKM